MRRRPITTGLALLVLLVFSAIRSAEAAHMLKLDDGTNPAVIITNAGVGDVCADPANGTCITFIGSIGVFIVNVSTGLSLGQSFLDLNTINVSSFVSGPAQTLTISHTDTGYTGVGDVGMQIGGTTHGTVQYKAYWDPGNAAFATTNLIGTIASSSSAFNGQQNPIGAGAVAPYSMTQVVTIRHTKGKSAKVTSLNAELELEVPEPSSVMFVGIAAALLGLGVSLRRL